MSYSHHSRSDKPKLNEEPPEQLIFVSYHSKEDQTLASALKVLFETVLEPPPNVFVAGEGGLLPSAQTYRNQLWNAARTAVAFVGIITSTSKDRAWIHFEAGAAWGRGRLYAPVLFGISAESLKDTIGAYQSICVDQPKQVCLLVEELAKLTDAQTNERKLNPAIKKLQNVVNKRKKSDTPPEAARCGRPTSEDGFGGSESCPASVEPVNEHSAGIKIALPLQNISVQRRPQTPSSEALPINIDEALQGKLKMSPLALSHSETVCTGHRFLEGFVRSYRRIIPIVAILLGYYLGNFVDNGIAFADGVQTVFVAVFLIGTLLLQGTGPKERRFVWYWRGLWGTWLIMYACYWAFQDEGQKLLGDSLANILNNTQSVFLIILGTSMPDDEQRGRSKIHWEYVCIGCWIILAILNLISWRWLNSQIGALMLFVSAIIAILALFFFTLKLKDVIDDHVFYWLMLGYSVVQFVYPMLRSPWIDVKCNMEFLRGILKLYALGMKLGLFATVVMIIARSWAISKRDRLEGES